MRARCCCARYGAAVPLAAACHLPARWPVALSWVLDRGGHLRAWESWSRAAFTHGIGQSLLPEIGPVHVDHRGRRKGNSLLLGALAGYDSGRRRYSVSMSDMSHRGRWLASVRRLFRWQPKNYWQVWLTAAAVGVIWFVIWSVRGELLAGMVFGGIIALAGGAAGSYRLPPAQGRHHYRGVDLDPASSASGTMRPSWDCARDRSSAERSP